MFNVESQGSGGHSGSGFYVVTFAELTVGSSFVCVLVWIELFGLLLW